MPANLIGLPERITYNRGYVVGVAFIGLSLFATLILLTLNSELSRTFPYFFLLPWILLLLFVLILPSVILFRHGKFNLGNPLVFATWSYFFPAFVLGGIALAVGWSQPYFLSYIQDAKTNLPWTIILIMLGYLGLAAGYFLPIGKAAGRIVGDYFTISSTTPISSFMLPGMLLLLVGILNSAIALELGVIGYQGNKEVASYDGLIILSTLFWLEATFVLWYVVFKSGQVNVRALSVVGVLITTSIFKASYSGNRGSLLQSLITVLIAFTLSGRSLTVKRTLIGSVLLILLLIVGMIYGTTFRNVRGDQTVGGIDTYTDNVIETIRRVNDNSGVDVVEFGLTHLAERLDVVSSLAVVVSNHEELAPYEESYGLDRNIEKDFVTTFIPRVLWNDKPVASDARRYGELYFDYGENSFAMTLIGDLLRNFGISGVFFGMGLLGIFLRTIYRALVENREVTMARATLYFMLLVSISYEGFYGLVFPYFIKIGIASLAGILLVTLLAKFFHRSAAGSMGLRSEGDHR